MNYRYCDGIVHLGLLSKHLISKYVCCESLHREERYLRDESSLVVTYDAITCLWCAVLMVPPVWQ